jgi:hypothetical protein
MQQYKQAENRRRLSEATSDYFESLTAEELSEESSIAQSLSKAAAGIDFELEP